MMNLRKIVFAAAALGLLTAGAHAMSGPSSAPLNPQPVTPGACTFTQTSVSTSSTSATLIAANPNRKLLGFYNVGGVTVTIVPGTAAAVAGAGVALNSAAGGAGNQGGSLEFMGTVAPTNAFQVISPSAGTVIVEECA